MAYAVFSPGLLSAATKLWRLTLWVFIVNIIFMNSAVFTTQNSEICL